MPNITASNVICLPSCGCKPAVRAKKDIKSVSRYKAKHSATNNRRLERIDLMREYLLEVRELTFRMEAIVKIAEHACNDDLV